MFFSKSLFGGVSLLVIANAQQAFRALHQLPDMMQPKDLSHFLPNPVCTSQQGPIAEPIRTFFTKCTCSQSPCEMQPSCTTDAVVLVTILIDIYLNPLKVEACISLDVAIRAVVDLLKAQIAIPLDLNVDIKDVVELKAFGDKVSETLGLSAFVGVSFNVEAFLGLFLKIDAAALIQTGITEVTAHIVVAIMPIMLAVLLCLSVNVQLS